MEPLLKFEELAARLKDDAPPSVHVAPSVMRRIRAARATSERALALLAAGSCVLAATVAIVGLSLLSGGADALERVFQIVPPIGL